MSTNPEAPAPQPAAGGLAELQTLARRIRGAVIEMSHRANTPHLGSSLSCVDMVVAAYWGALALDPRRPADPQRDRFLLSKGHAATTLYAALAYRGFFPEHLLQDFNRPGSKLPEHPTLGLPGVEAATGSLGHGLSIGIGMALAGRIQRQPFRVYALLSDGECNEGSVWEAAMMASAQRLERLCIMVDYNKWQATGRSDDTLALAPLAGKWAAFGWSVSELDGHDVATLRDRLRQVPDGSGRPVALICHTVKGKGVSFMEDDNNWHYRVPNAEEVAAARVELGLA
jgi:transketolase